MRAISTSPTRHLLDVFRGHRVPLSMVASCFCRVSTRPLFPPPSPQGRSYCHRRYWEISKRPLYATSARPRTRKFRSTTASCVRSHAARAHGVVHGARRRTDVVGERGRRPRTCGTGSDFARRYLRNGGAAKSSRASAQTVEQRLHVVQHPPEAGRIDPRCRPRIARSPAARGRGCADKGSPALTAKPCPSGSGKQVAIAARGLEHDLQVRAVLGRHVLRMNAVDSNRLLASGPSRPAVYSRGFQAARGARCGTTGHRRAVFVHLHQYRYCQMIVVVAAHARQVMLHADAMSLQLRGVANARKHQQLRRLHGARTKQYFTPCATAAAGRRARSVSRHPWRCRSPRECG